MKFATRLRSKQPLPNRSQLSPEEEAQSAIVESELIKTLLEFPLENEDIWNEPGSLDIKSWLLFTSNIPGLVVFDQMFPQPDEQAVSIIHDQYIEWEERIKPPYLPIYYRHFWHYFEPFPYPLLDEEQSQKFSSVPLSAIRLHTSGHYFGPLSAREDRDLWYWTGSELKPMNISMGSWIS